MLRGGWPAAGSGRLAEEEFVVKAGPHPASTERETAVKTAETIMTATENNPDRALHGEAIVFAVLIALGVLLPLAGVPRESLTYDSSRAAHGEWWRALTHPWVHIGAYHLLLDAGSFLLLYLGLTGRSTGARLTLVLGSLAGSLAAALAAGTGLAQHGLCGLSGTAHGLMMAACADVLDRTGEDRVLRRAAAAMFAVTALKAAWECMSGQVFLARWHLGDIGVPIAACHAGGALGGLLVLAWQRIRQAAARPAEAKDFSFQRLENRREIFPTIGKDRRPAAWPPPRHLFHTS